MSEAGIWWERSKVSLSRWGGWILGSQGTAQPTGSTLFPAGLCTLHMKRNHSHAAHCSNVKHNRSLHVNFKETAVKYILWHLPYIWHSGLRVKMKYVSVKFGQPYFTVSGSASQLVGIASGMRNLPPNFKWDERGWVYGANSLKCL